MLNLKLLLIVRLFLGSATVHGKTLPNGFGRFFITREMKSFNKYPEFDDVKTIFGTAILWNFNDCKKFKAAELNKSGTKKYILTLCDKK